MDPGLMVTMAALMFVTMPNNNMPAQIITRQAEFTLGKWFMGPVFLMIRGFLHTESRWRRERSPGRNHGRRIARNWRNHPNCRHATHDRPRDWRQGRLDYYHLNTRCWSDTELLHT